MKNIKLTDFICFKKTLWIYTPFFISNFWMSSWGKRNVSKDKTVSLYQMSQLSCCRLGKSGLCKARKILLLPDFATVRGKEVERSNSKPRCNGRGSLATIVALTAPARDCRCSRLGIWQAREEGGRSSCKERLCQSSLRVLEVGIAIPASLIAVTQTPQLHHSSSQHWNIAYHFKATSCPFFPSKYFHNFQYIGNSLF